MNKKLTKYQLDYIKALDFFVEKIVNAGFLITESFKSFDFSKGSFFTLLPPESNIECLYNFSQGGITQQKPIQTDEKGGKYQIVNNIDDAAVDYFYELMQRNETHSWIFVDAFGAYTQRGKEFYDSYGISAQGEKELEVCFILNKNNADIEAMRECIEICRLPFWFFLGIFSAVNISTISNRKMSVESIGSIANGAELLILNAYDGESFVFWEKN